jgi:uncharacterized membrane protein YedE/YeeE
MIDLLKHPWPWYISGFIIGLMVPALLIAGNKSFGISANFRHICAVLFPGNVRFFRYNWKKELWNLFFAAGIIAGGFIALHFLIDPNPVQVSPKLLAELKNYDITDTSKLLPSELFSWPALFSVRGFILLVGGGFMVGFGTRYAGGCTSGHAIMGLSNLQWPSLVATISFMLGGFIMANLILPYILSL